MLLRLSLTRVTGKQPAQTYRAPTNEERLAALRQAVPPELGNSFFKFPPSRFKPRVDGRPSDA